jgi:hypothetical protein
VGKRQIKPNQTQNIENHSSSALYVIKKILIQNVIGKVIEFLFMIDQTRQNRERQKERQTDRKRIANPT